MKSKWERIKDACNELGYEEAAGIAGEIETMLKEIYGDTKTVAWMRDYIDIKYGCLTAMQIGHISSSVKYCIACMNDRYCYDCRFAKCHKGGCFEDDTLFQQFIKTFYVEADII